MVMWHWEPLYLNTLEAEAGGLPQAQGVNELLSKVLSQIGGAEGVA